VPGFPQHPHRGFETVTLARRGYIDHSDSLGAAARFGRGDAQWLTAGGGIVHSEMFPAARPKRANPVELFQIWLNLPGEDKLAKPHFAMLWEGEIPRHVFKDDAGRSTEVTTVAGELSASARRRHAQIMGRRAPIPTSRSGPWRLEAGATWTLPPAKNPEAIRHALLLRRLQHQKSTTARSPSTPRRGPVGHRSEARSRQRRRRAVAAPRPPHRRAVAQHGPFVMNSRAELQQAFSDYQRTQFGGWPWPANDPVHERESGRFARHVDGRMERAE